MYGHSWTRGLAAIVVSIAAAACGNNSKAPAETAGSAPVAAPAAALAVNRCPLTAEHVTAAVGSPVKQPDSSCGFFPVDDNKITPHVIFVMQNQMACNGTMPQEIGYKEKLEGLGHTAYIADQGDGSHVLVCRGDSPFEIGVDVGDSAKARAAATALAKKVLEGS
jgi:hypothetical protein